MTTVIRAASAADFLALVPRLLGFRPTRSIVLVPFAGNRTLGAMRFDLPDADDADETDSIASTLIGLVCKVANADAVAAIVYTDGEIGDDERLPSDALIGALITRADLCGLRVSDALCVAADAWGSYLDRALPIGGRALDDIPYDHDALAGLPVVAGDQSSGVELPRADLASTERVGRALHHLATSASHEPEAIVRRDPDDDGWLLVPAAAALSNPPLLFESALRWAPDDLAPADAAVIIWALARPALRDIALVQWAGDRSLGEAALDAQLAWADGEPYPEEIAKVMWGEGVQPDPARIDAALALCRRAAALAPRSARPGALSACAWLAWALGRSTHAAAYARMALEIEADHGLSGIVRAVTASGRLPEWAFDRSAPATGPVTRVVDSRRTP